MEKKSHVSNFSQLLFRPGPLPGLPPHMVPIGHPHGPPMVALPGPLGPHGPQVPLPLPQGPAGTEPPNPEATLAALAEAVPSIGLSTGNHDEIENGNGNESKSDEENTDVDADELALLGIDPSDFAGFGKDQNL